MTAVHQNLLGTIQLYENTMIFTRFSKDGAGGTPKAIPVKRFVEAFKHMDTRVEPELIEPGLFLNPANRAYPTLGYHCPPGLRTIQFEGHMWTIPCPGMVFLADRGHLAAYAVKDPVLRKETRLYAAPFPNVDPVRGSVCTGTVKFPPFTNGTMALVAKTFFESPFTGHSMQGKSVRSPKNILRLLKTLKNQTAYPLEDLVPSEDPKFIDDLLK